MPVLEIPQQSDTRWVCKHKGVQLFKSRLVEVCKVLEYFVSEGKPKERAEAKGLLLQLKSATTVFLLHFFDVSLGMTHSLSMHLQSKYAQFSQAYALVQATIASIKNMRNEDYFQQLLLGVKNACVKNNIDVEYFENNGNCERERRIKKMSKSLKDSFVLTTLGKRHYDDVEINENENSKRVDQLKRILFEIIDKMCSEMERRFTGNEELLLTCDTLQPNSNLFMNAEQMTKVSNNYQFLGIDSAKLSCEVTVAKQMLINMNVKNLENVFKSLFQMKLAFPNLIKICQFVLTLPVSSASAERSFSTLKRVKTYLRSCMSDMRLSHLCMLSIERELSKDLVECPDAAVNYFASMKDRRLHLL
jgi:hypothetical protein